MYRDNLYKVRVGIIKISALLVLIGLLVPPVIGQDGQAEDKMAHQSTINHLNNSDITKAAQSSNALLDKEITLRMGEVTLREALEEVSQKAGLKLTYSESNVRLDGKVSANYENLSVNETIWNLLEDTPLQFVVSKSGNLILYNKIVLPKVQEEVYQTGTLSGTVIDERTDNPVVGANVYIPELERGTATDAQGRYTIGDIPPGTYEIEVSYIGYSEYTTEVEIGDEEDVELDINLESDVTNLDEIRVTALGFEEDRDRSSISSTSISSDAIGASGENDLLGSLSAKSSGLSITSASGDPGAASRTVIRGAVSLQGDNQPLFIVDGVPLSNSTIGNSIAGVNQQSRINDLNPRDIESVEVLKGPSASAQWGSRAANGAIVIQTKRGSFDQDLNVNFTSEVSVDEINKSVDMQTKYGQGTGGEYVWGSSDSWGDKIEDRSGGEDVRARDNYAYSEIIEKNSRETYDQSTRFFDTGYGVENSLRISGGGPSSTFNLSVGNLNQDGIALANSNYNRTTIRSTVEREFHDVFTARVNANYTRTNSDRQQRGSNIGSLALGAYRSPPDFDADPYLVDYVDENGNVIPNVHRSYRNPSGNPDNSPGYDNPLWAINENLNNSKVNRFFGNTELNYDPYSWLTITHRLGLDFSADRRYEHRPPGNASFPSGVLNEQNYSEYQINSDLIARSAFDLNEDLNVSILAGWNLNHREYDELTGEVTDFVIPTGPKNLGNGLDRFPGNYESTQRTSALYSEAQFTAYDQLGFDLSARSESASTYGPDTDNTYLYPSAGLSWEFTELSSLDNDLLSFGKLRASFGRAGVQPDVYLTQTTFVPATFGDSYGGTINSLEYGRGTTQSSQLGNSQLKPEITSEYEFGTDLRFFDDRVNLSATLYQTYTKDAILGLDIAPTSGFSNIVSNGAEIENDGIELELSGDVIQLDKFQWTANLNWSKNNSEVTDLSGVNSVTLGGIGTITNRAIVGEPFGVLYGSVWERDENGDRVLNSNGFPVQASDDDIIGDPNPDWRAGIYNTFNYGPFSLGILFDVKHGGDISNSTRGRMLAFGTHGSQDWETTADQDVINYNGDTIEEGTTFRGYIEDFGDGPVAVDEAYFTSGPGSGFTGPTEQEIEDGGYVKLRELSARYSINTARFQDWSGLTSIDLGVKARNLLLWTDYSGIDPETNLSGTSNAFGNDYYNNPNTRSWIFSLSVNY